METGLNYLDLFVGLCAVIVWCFGAYHDFMFKKGWRQEWSEGRGRWGLYNVNIPEPYRTHRRRSNQMMFVFFGIMAVGCIVLYTRQPV